MSYTYGVLGAGRQGTASAYDFAKFGKAKKILIADCDKQAAQRSAERVNRLLGQKIAEPHHLNVTDQGMLERFLEPIDSFVSAVPYWLNPDITQVAIRAKASMTDLGGKTDLVLKQTELCAQAKEAGIAVIPDCGQVPGMGTSLMVYAMTFLDHTEEIKMWDGGNPLHPTPPFHYFLTFNISGLVNEYACDAIFLRNGKRVLVPTFLDEDYETVDFPKPIGTMEAFVAGGGTSTLPWTFEGKVKTLWNKTLRWPGHFAAWKAYKQLGLFDSRPVNIDGIPVSPRAVLETLADPLIRAKPNDKDLVIIRILATGTKQGKPAHVTLELIDQWDEQTGFTAMERTTGWDASMKAILNAEGATPRGVYPTELAIGGQDYVVELRKRGLVLKESFSLGNPTV